MLLRWLRRYHRHGYYAIRDALTSTSTIVPRELVACSEIAGGIIRAYLIMGLIAVFIRPFLASGSLHLCRFLRRIGLRSFPVVSLTEDAE